MFPDDWRWKARCRSEPTEVFFPAQRHNSQQWDLQVRRAKQVCATCPVIEQCGEHALSRPEHYGIWGGMTPIDRAIERRRRRKTARSAA